LRKVPGIGVETTMELLEIFIRHDATGTLLTCEPYIAGTFGINDVNLLLAHKIIAAVETQPYGFLKVRGREAAHQVQEMAAAGLVKASGLDPIDPLEAIINEVTDMGHEFFRTLRSLSD
jgi:hypothetical protein